MINEIKTLVLEECYHPFWKTHITSVVKHAKQLAKQYQADEEVVEIASWLHDIAKLRKIKGNHHLKGAEIAETILKKYNYKKIEQVKDCIITHSSDKNYPPKTIEQKIISVADSLCFIDEPIVLFHWVLQLKQTPLEEANEKIKTNFKKAFFKLSYLPEIEKKYKPTYDAMMLILRDSP